MDRWMDGLLVLQIDKYIEKYKHRFTDTYLDRYMYLDFQKGLVRQLTLFITTNSNCHFLISCTIALIPN